MILPTMSFLQMFKSLEADAGKVKIRIEKLLPKAIKKFKAEGVFPNYYIDEYVIPSSNNHHIIFFYAGYRDEIEHPHYTSFCIVFDNNQRFLIRGTKMGYQHTPDSTNVMLPQIHAYTSHFFKRYNERFLHKDNLSANEVAGLYFVRNTEKIPIKLNDKINHNFKAHGINNKLGWRIRDGFCYTQSQLEGIPDKEGHIEKDLVNAMGIIYTTFISKDDMSNSQKEAIDKEHLNVYRHCLSLLKAK